ncbi:MAG: hypothetical protein U5L73_08850 [Rhodoferax sp.]|uniref:hypothetical protein n=1 Tax=Rhodoferax sp. TaxID=50421 RepID=UPI002ACE2CBB|nr:hypothetical protein [Rhodoferax sp.]MDZ7891855.1 hypothetical protein [Rhodoferax sp.]
MTSTPTNTTALADALNHGCRCQPLDAAQLQRELVRDAGLRDVASTLAQTHPHQVSLFQRHGMWAVVTDPAGLQLRDGVLYSGALPTDLAIGVGADPAGRLHRPGAGTAPAARHAGGRCGHRSEV